MEKEYPPGLDVTDIIPVHLGELAEVTNMINFIDRFGPEQPMLTISQWEQIRDFIRSLNV